MNDKPKRIPLVEMFGPTIQGEGSVIGLQTYFLRFGLCDYKCVMCDSMNAVDPHEVKKNATWYTQEELFKAFLKIHKPNSTRWITLSGGNPCIHNLTGLVESFSDNGFLLAVETQGTAAPDWLRSCAHITVSPKGPGMGAKLHLPDLDNFLDRMYRLGRLNVTAIKIVVFDQRDLEFAKMIRERYTLSAHMFYLSLGNPFPPGHTSEEFYPGHTEYVMSQIGRYKMLLEDIQQDHTLSKFKFLPQWHTFLWGNDKGR